MSKRVLIKVQNPDNNPPPKKGYYQGIVTVGDKKSVETVYWTGKIFTQEEWKSCKVIGWFNASDILEKYAP